jgi:MOB kinase activator 1
MASLLTTMYEFLNSSPSPQPLTPHLTLKQSSSCVTINSYTFLDNQQEAKDKEAACSPSTPSRALQLLRQELKSSPSPSPKSKRIDRSPSPSSNARTRGQFKPQRTNKGTTSYQLRQFAEATLGSGSLRKAVKLPEGEDLNEWLAVNGKPTLRSALHRSDKMARARD